MRAWVLLLLGLSGCSESPEPEPTPVSPLSGCEDADCRRELVQSLWGDEEKLKEALQWVEAPVERAALVLKLSEAHPGQTAALCGVLEAGSERERCAEINRRAHLWTDLVRPGEREREDDPVPRPSDYLPSTPEQGPEQSARSGLVPTVDLGDPWSSVSAVVRACGGQLSQKECQTREAMTAASNSQSSQAAALCLAIEDDTWRHECFFLAAEEAYEEKADLAVRESILLCLGAGPYQEACFAHLAMGIGREAPSASSGRSEAWVLVQAALSEIDREVGGQDPVFAQAFAERTWSEALQFAYRSVRRVTGDPLDVVPQSARVHVRSAAAWRLWELEADNDRALELWVDRLEQALVERQRGSVEPLSLAPRALGILSLWREVLPGEQDLPVTLYMGQARRAWSDDARADATICMLEAFARSRPPRVDLVAQGLEHEDEMVRWTAARLVQAVDHKGTYLPQLAAHPDALVRARSGRLQRRRDEAKPPPGKVPELARRDRPPSANDSEEESGTDPLAARSRLAPGPSKKDGPTSKPAKEVRGHPQSKVNSPYYPQTELKTVEEGTEEP